MTSALKRLIVNADDLGRTPGVNQGVVQAHRTGIVTSASLMVNHPTAAEAKGIATDNPELGIGLHLALTGGPPTLGPSLVRSLVDAKGLLPTKPEGLAAADPAEVLAEVRAQIRRFREITGALPTHLDTHHHAHTVPAVLEALVIVCWEMGLPARGTSTEMRERLRHERIPTPDQFVEAFFGDDATLEHLVRILSGLDPGTTELMCHPAVVDEALRKTSGYAEPRGRELAALTHRDARQAIQAAGIRLVNWGAL